jgi:MFS family permease
LSDRFGAPVPVLAALAVGTAVSILVPLAAGLPLLIGVLVAGTPFYGSLFAPASAMVSAGAQHSELNQGIAFALSNLAWAAGQAIAAAGSGALAQATSDLVPYALLSTACLATLADLLRRGRGSAASSASSASSANS